MIDKKQFVVITINSLCKINNHRYFSNERGYQAEFYCELKKELNTLSIQESNAILEMEYQKSSRHHISQRPDIIFHLPAEISGSSVDVNNYGVWALKRCGSPNDAKSDFKKINEMFETLNYAYGCFINIDHNHHHLNHYSGNYPERIICCSIKIKGEKVNLKYAYFNENRESIENLIRV